MSVLNIRSWTAGNRLQAGIMTHQKDWSYCRNLGMPKGYRHMTKGGFWSVRLIMIYRKILYAGWTIMWQRFNMTTQTMETGYGNGIRMYRASRQTGSIPVMQLSIRNLRTVSW